MNHEINTKQEDKLNAFLDFVFKNAFRNEKQGILCIDQYFSGRI
jgi:hypothetical protein